MKLRIATLLACLVAMPSAWAAGEATASDRWYVISLAGQAAGYGHESTLPRGSGSRTDIDTHLAVQRMNTRVDFSVLQSEDEDADGRLLHLQAHIHSSRDENTLEVQIDAGHLRITTGAGGRLYTRELDESRVLLGAEGARLRTRSWLANPDEALVYTTFVAEQGTVATVTRRLLRHEAHAGHASLALVEQRTEGLPQPSRLWLDADGRAVEELEESPLGTLSARLATAEAAQATVGAMLGEDVYARSLLPAQVRLPSARRLERLRVRLALLRPDSGWADLEGPGQHVLEATPTQRLLEVSRADPEPDAPIDARPDDPQLQPNVLLQSDHPAVVALAAELRRPGLPAFAQARVVQQWVATHLQFDAGLAVAPASEVVRDRRGSCVAYAVLTAALARALGIPARVILGYVYVDNIFGGHAWTEVRVGGRWLPIDAALYGAGTADAARIALVRHGGELGIGSGTKELSQLSGNLSIRIEGYTLDGHSVTVPSGAAPWTVSGHQYRNPWLGLTLRSPPGFEFAALDARYPDPTVVGLRSADGATIRLLALPLPAGSSPDTALLASLGAPSAQPARPIAGHPAVEARPLGSRLLGVSDGDTLWVLWATGSAAGTPLDQVASSLRLAR